MRPYFAVAMLAPLSITVSAANYYPSKFTISRDSLQVDTLNIGDSLLVKQVSIISEEVKEIHETLQELEEETNAANARKKLVHFGLSLGYRWLTTPSANQNMLASVSPMDSTLRLTKMERTSYLFSTSVIFDLNLGKNQDVQEADHIMERRSQKRVGHSFKSHHARSTVPIRTGRTGMGKFLYKSVDRLCIISNLNILDFSSGQKELAFNKSIEGGLGIGYRLNETMYIGFNWEHVQVWQLHEDIRAMENQKIRLYGEPLVSSEQLDTSNEDLFYKKNLSGWGLKLIVSL